MNSSSQIHIPPSFVALYLPPGKLKPSLAFDELAQRYELCEDMASLLTERAQEMLHGLGITEDDVLQRCLQGLQAEPAVVSAAEAFWVVCRLAELLGWGLPEAPA